MISFVHNFVKVTSWHRKYWQERKLDWDASYLQTWNHPHRALIIEVLKGISWFSLFEIGCGSGPNLLRIAKEMGDRQLGGCDINPDAIDLALRTFKGGVFKVSDASDIMMSDKSADILLYDAVLMYVSFHDIRRYLKEAKRVARKYILLCELHSSSLLNRLALKLNTGYNAYNWVKLLESEGFYDVASHKIPKEVWPGTPWETFGTIILAKVPKR